MHNIISIYIDQGFSWGIWDSLGAKQKTRVISHRGFASGKFGKNVRVRGINVDSLSIKGVHYVPVKKNWDGFT